MILVGGAGFPTCHVAQLVAPGRVIGVDVSDVLFEQAWKDHAGVGNLSFEKRDITSDLLSMTADVVTSFMVIHNMPIGDVRLVFANTQRHSSRAEVQCS